MKPRRFSNASGRPRSPNRDFDITRYGASGDGAKDSTDAIRRAIAACQPGRRRPRGRSGGRVSHRRDPPQEQRQPARRRGRDTALQPRPAQVPAGGLHALGRRRVHELLAVHLRLRAGEHRRHRRTARSTARRIANTGGPGRGAPTAAGRRATRARSRRGTLLIEMAEKDVPVEKRVFGEGNYLRPELHPALPLRQRADRGRHACATRPCGRSTRCSRATSPSAA